MLDVSSSQEVTEIWTSLDSRVQLSQELTGLLGRVGRIRSREDRSHQRHELRSKAILNYAGKLHGVYLKDCSRSGMGFLSPIQLFPLDQIVLKAENKRSYVIQIARCRRVQANCYECGGTFVAN